MDRVTEAIAHFIGLFEVNNEEARQREAYDRFSAEKKLAPDIADLPGTSLAFSTPYDFAGYTPGFLYRDVSPNWVLYQPWSFVDFDPPLIPGQNFEQLAKPLMPVPQFALGTAYKIVLPTVETIGSVANFISQGIKLSDNDYFGVGGHSLLFDPGAVDDSNIINLAGQAAILSPIDDFEMAGSAEGLIDFVTTASIQLEDFSEDGHGDADVSVHKSTSLQGSYVNGEKVDEAPKLEDYHKFAQVGEEEAEHEDTHSASGSHVGFVQDNASFQASVSLETGGNTLVNNVLLKNMWTASSVMAVVGKHIELNAVIQINAWCDTDAVSSMLNGWQNGSGPTEAFNIATFERSDPAEDDEDGDAGGFPLDWVVKEIDGDLMIVNWLQQFTFMKDNDIGILSSSGVTTSVYSGGNMTYNDISIQEIGFGYDLIIVGGSVYDANIIHQLNILCDNDLIGALAGFEMTGEGSVQTSGNLLWNQAYIYNVGGADRFESLPDHFREAAKKLSEGDTAASAAMLKDPMFAGIGALKVLYIKGDLVNVQYSKQTNILGDSDQIALAMHETDPFSNADWTISTGANVLVNNTGILDVDSLGKTYVGDGHYSNDILIQADIISTDPEFGGQDPDKLVSEAVAFLDDDMLGDGDDTSLSSDGLSDFEGPQDDGLQSILA